MAAAPAGAACNWIDGQWSAKAPAVSGCSDVYAEIAITRATTVKCNATGQIRYNNENRDVCGTLALVDNRNYTLIGDVTLPNNRDVDQFRAIYPSTEGACEIEIEITTDNRRCPVRLQLQRKDRN